ncbi:phosphatidylserine decarboxylase proenzyme 2-like isoform X3 [Phoenix dactylifera]|uniref:Phosphatidylserine decarboxylase proenzyme 2-like isoform X3 n=1 Tax=Phoenix dactylifera TaxID=42345 RepID=A0A8B7CXE4_PHODC|nr:phosphatidylserine decarboxylase proenzyme 2-like isoform X3 [Phoenix dactylifera]
MGHGSSRPDSGEPSPDADTAEAPVPSRFARFRRRLRFHRSGSDQLPFKNLAAEDFAGIARIEIIGAEMKFKDRWLACLSFGERTYRTDKSDHTEKPVWRSEKKVILERNGPHIARISVFETNRLSRNNLVGYCEIDLWKVLSEDSEDNLEGLSLLDPSSSNTIVGSISISCYVEDPIETEKAFARRVLAVVDYNEDGKLSYSEFTELISAFGNEVAASKKEELFKQADKNGDGVVDMDELAILLSIQQEKESLISNCPVCGENLGKYDKMNDMLHMTLCFDEGTGNQSMTGGFLTDKQASYGWMFKLSEWAHFASYGIGLKSGSSASHILVFDRRTKRLVEETIDRRIILSMRAIYQSKVGLTLIDKGTRDLLRSISEKQGTWMNSPESAKDIPKFIKSFEDQVNMDEVKHPIEYFKTFNEFFIRELKPGARPIAYVERDDIAICAADSRLMAFTSVDDSLRFWIKVAFVAIGATMVGSITFLKKEGDYVHKGDEFGYFSFGGSTVICVFEKDAIQIDEDLLANSERSLETLVSVGMTLGVSRRKQATEEMPRLENCTLGA